MQGVGEKAVATWWVGPQHRRIVGWSITGQQPAWGWTAVRAGLGGRLLMASFLTSKILQELLHGMLDLLFLLVHLARFA